MQETDDLGLLTAAAEAAGDIALGYFRADPRIWDKGRDDPVTEADIAVDGYLKDRLLASRPAYGWLSEETPDSEDRLEAETLFIVDPIDGTRAFINGGEDWALSLAVARRGRIAAAVVFLPARKRLFTASAGRGAALNGAPLSATDGPLSPETTVLASAPTFDAKNWQDPAVEVQRRFRTSIAYRLSLVGEGRFDAMITLRPSWEWDIAAGSLIAAEAGATVTDGSGMALEFNSPGAKLAGVLAAGPMLHAELLRRLAPRAA